MLMSFMPASSVPAFRYPPSAWAVGPCVALHPASAHRALQPGFPAPLPAPPTTAVAGKRAGHPSCGRWSHQARPQETPWRSSQLSALKWGVLCEPSVGPGAAPWAALALTPLQTQPWVLRSTVSAECTGTRGLGWRDSADWLLRCFLYWSRLKVIV